MVALKAAPDWAAAAQGLVDGCAHAPNAAWRTELLERVCAALGDQLYPAFLNVLCLVGERGSDAAQAAVADALVDALCSGRLPAGRRPAWGLAGRWGEALGPLEYLCVGYADPPAGQAPSAAHADRALQALLALLWHSPRAWALYAARVQALTEAPPDGTLTRGARQALLALAAAMQASGATPASAAAAVLAAHPGAGTGLAALVSTPPVFR
ncbi:MAG: hypothetical protein ACK5QH_06090 [Rubrivivax sp.]|jgi:hypothetical protein